MLLRRLLIVPSVLAITTAIACANVLVIEDRSALVDDAAADAADAANQTGDAASRVEDAGVPTDAGVLVDARALSEAAPDATAPDAHDAEAQDGDAETRTAPEAGPDVGADATVADAFPDAPIADALVDSRDGGPAADSGGPGCADPCLLASGLNHPFLMTADSSRVYWTEFGDTLGSGNGSLKSCPTSGCNPAGPTVLAQGLINPRGIAVDADNVYFGTASYGGVAGGIWKCAVAGCSGSPTRMAAAGIPYGVATDATSVYWVDDDDQSVRSVEKTGMAARVVYDGGPYDDAGDTIYDPGQCVVDGPFLYFMDYNEDALRVSLADGTIANLGSGFNNQRYGNLFGLATDNNSLYFGGNGLIQSVPKAAVPVPEGGTATVADGVATPLGIAYDPSSATVYWANYGSGSTNDGTVGKVGADGGGSRVLQASLDTPEAMALSGAAVFWISSGKPNPSGDSPPSTGALWRTAK
jgi:hypothetical protein